MKRVRLTLGFLVLTVVCMAQPTTELTAGYYTVVAAYDNSRQEYAERYMTSVKEQGYDAKVGLNPSQDMFFVYVQTHTNLRDALRGMYEVRKKEQFKDAWVRVVPGVIGQQGETVRPKIIDTETPSSAVAPQQPPAAEPVKKEEIKPLPVEEVSVIPSQENNEPSEKAIEAEEEIIRQEYPMTLGNSEVFLSLFNAANNRIIDGDVAVIDTDRGRMLKTVKGNEYLSLPDPKNESGKVTLICDVFGYRKLQLDINYRNPEKDTVMAHVDMMGLSFVVLFDLVRYRKGDLQTLSHVYFFNDAALMIPESRYEINQLQQMMTENPKMKIRLHGHTNGHYHGKIIKMGKEKNFFAIGKDAVSTVGSAKDLSFERAEIIKEYLVDNGVSGDRIEVKGWGGKKPLFDKHSANARKNVRVEVEVLAE